MICVYGSTGMLGSCISNYFENEGFDIKRMKRDDGIISSDIAINCAGLIKQKMNAGNEVEAIQINSVFPYLLMENCKHLIQISTDCVFSGKKGNYIETDIPDAVDLYGMTKAAGEPECSVIRTSFVGESKFKGSLLEWVRSNCGEEINGYTNHLWNGVTCLQLAKAIAEIICEKKYWKGIRHYFSETVTKSQLVRYISELYCKDITINDITAEESIDRTLGTIHENTFIKASGILEQLKEQKNFMEEYKNY